MRNLRWLLLLGAVVLEVGCGLPDAYYLAPPQANTGLLQYPSTQNVQIAGTNRSSDLDIQFLGYELYYKFYAPNDTSIVQDRSYGGPNNTVSDLQQHGFQRVSLGPGSANDGSPDRYGTSNSPLINIQNIDPGNLANGGYTINIIIDSPALSPSVSGFGFLTYPAGHYSYFTYSPPGVPTTTPTSGSEIRRIAQEPSYIESGQYCAPFASNSNWTGQTQLNYDDVAFAQVDISALSSVWLTQVQNPGGFLDIQMYAVSYGLSTGLSYQRSSPVLLGDTAIQVLN
jgi:hypothetical protein